jgi:hypothetical protein
MGSKVNPSYTPTLFAPIAQRLRIGRHWITNVLLKFRVFPEEESFTQRLHGVMVYPLTGNLMNNAC